MEDTFKVEDAYYVGISTHGFREGEPARITGAKICTPSGLPPRLCFIIKYSDGKIDEVPLCDLDKAYVVKTLREICNLLIK
jgi:hypothetical protein